MQDPQKGKTFPSTGSTEVFLVTELVLVNLLHPLQPDIVIHVVGYLLASQKHSHHKVKKTDSSDMELFFSRRWSPKNCHLEEHKCFTSIWFSGCPPARTQLREGAVVRTRTPLLAGPQQTIPGALWLAALVSAASSLKGICGFARLF